MNGNDISAYGMLAHSVCYEDSNTTQSLYIYMATGKHLNMETSRTLQLTVTLTDQCHCNRSMSL